jgi:hypothetical protein
MEEVVVPDEVTADSRRTLYYPMKTLCNTPINRTEPPQFLE